MGQDDDKTMKSKRAYKYLKASWATLSRTRDSKYTNTNDHYLLAGNGIGEPWNIAWGNSLNPGCLA